MPNTYTQIYIQYIFAVQDRISLIQDKWKAELYKYIHRIIENQGHKCFVINGIADHIHLLVSMNPKQASSDLMYHVKRSSSLWINDNKLVRGKFSWQEGFGGFSYSKSQVPRIITYIENQEKHHKKQNFIDEYLKFLKLFDIEYDERYVFKRIE
jgi:putative transposase